MGTWGYDRGKMAYTIQNKIDRFQEVLSERLKYTQIEQNKAHKVIQSRDTPTTSVYANPPYVDTDQGHYGGDTSEHFRRDLDALVAMKGRFLLSSYPGDILKEYVDKYGWHTKSFDKSLTANNGAKTSYRKRKVEVLTVNYDIK